MEEEEKLLDYMKTFGEEPWAKENIRLKTYIKTQLSKVPKSKSTKTSTTSRLGFSNNGYNQLDVAGTNEIVRGNLSTINIEFNG